MQEVSEAEITCQGACSLGFFNPSMQKKSRVLHRTIRLVAKEPS